MNLEIIYVLKSYNLYKHRFLTTQLTLVKTLQQKAITINFTRNYKVTTGMREVSKQ